jgi:hypothetical protein
MVKLSSHPKTGRNDPCHAPVKEYLAAVLPGLDRRTLSEVPGLTPARWNASRG